MIMEMRTQAVLDGFHERMRQERRLHVEGLDTDWRDRHLLAVGPETGQLLNILVRSLSAPRILEIGTSFGYSGIWLADAARATGGRLTTIEIDPAKSSHASEKAREAGLDDHVDFLVGDALGLLGELPGPWDFVLLDLWKDLYLPCFDIFLPRLAPNAIVVADNMIRPGGEAIERYARAVRTSPGMASVRVPVGTGLEISRLEAEDGDAAVRRSSIG